MRASRRPAARHRRRRFGEGEHGRRLDDGQSVLRGQPAFDEYGLRRLERSSSVGRGATCDDTHALHELLQTTVVNDANADGYPADDLSGWWRDQPDEEQYVESPSQDPRCFAHSRVTRSARARGVEGRLRARPDAGSEGIALPRQAGDQRDGE